MRKFTAISFLLIFLVANTSFGQILKLPELVHHYFEHHDHDGDITFLDFLFKHYNEKKDHDSANNEHGRLPFKSHDLGLSQTTFAYQSPISFEFQTEKPFLIKEDIFYNENFSSSSIRTKIWQPPKFR